MKDDSNAEALSEYEAKRRQRMEENKRKLESLQMPALLRASPRPQAPKPAVTLEPTRRSSRQQKMRAIAEQEEQEKLLEDQKMMLEHEARQKERKLQNDLKKQRAAQIAADKQQQKLKRKQERQVEAQAKKQRKLGQSQKLKAQERKLEQELQLALRRQEQAMARQQEHMRRQQLKWQQQNEIPPEQIAKRNADIQKFIQEELDKQARLAKEKKRREVEQQKWRDEQNLQQQEMHVTAEGDATIAVADGSKAAVTTEGEAATSGAAITDFELSSKLATPTDYSPPRDRSLIALYSFVDLPSAAQEPKVPRLHSSYFAMSANIPTKALPSGANNPVIGLGVYKAGPGDEAYNTVLSALKLGYRHIDTAQFYQNEADVGRAVRDSGIPREDVFVSSKLFS